MNKEPLNSNAVIHTQLTVSDESVRRMVKDLEEAQHASLNIIEDLQKSKEELEMTQNAYLNIMEDMDKKKEELKESKEFAELICKVTPSAIFTVDNEKRITSWNIKATQITGFSQEEMIGKSCSAFTEEPCRSKCGLYDSLTQKPINARECSIIHKSGKRIFISKNVDILKDINGIIIGGIESFEDISGRKLAEETLRKRVKELNCLYIIADLIEKDDSMEKILQDSADVMPNAWSHPEIACVRIIYRGEQYQTANFHKTEWRQSADIKVDGQPVGMIEFCYLEERTIRDEGPFLMEERNLINAIAERIGRVVERKQAEEALKESEEKFRSYIENAPDGVFIVDDTGHYIGVNDSACSILGYSEDEILNFTIHDLLAKESFEDGLAHFKKIIETGMAISDLLHKHKDGSTRWLTINAVKLSQTRILGFAKDITERRQVEIALQKAKEEAENANRAKSDFLATMSHEIRTPLNGVIGMTELALTTNLSVTQRDYLESVQTSAYTLLDTINNILDFSKIEAGKLEIEKEEFNIREMIEKSVDILTASAYEKNIELLCEIEPTLPDFFIGDALRIRQILVNLISNAIKFTEKGEIHISVKKQVDMDNPEENVRVLFSVKDTGIGIPKNKLVNIFDHFIQADSSTTRKYGGTGLGLAISKNLTEMMKGTLMVESEPDTGSTFSFEIPLKVLKTKGAKTKPLKLSLTEEIKRVLIVDDNATNRKIMQGMFTYWGIDSVLASNGDRALELLREANKNMNFFDIVFLDMHMPLMDGLTVAEKIKYELDLVWMPVIIMFSSIEKGNIIEIGKKLGIDQYLTKPVKMNNLFEVLLNVKNKNQKKKEQTIIEIEKENPDCIGAGINIFSGKTILIAEDNSINLKLLNSMLMKTGAKILIATDGAEAIERYKNNSVDMIFMDVFMPGTDGFQATKFIREKEGAGKHTPIIALTAIAMQGDREKCLAYGMDDYLSKPFKIEDLYEMARKYLLQPVHQKIASHVELQESEKIFNKQELLSHADNDKEFYKEIIADFKKLFPDLLKKLMQAIKDSDYKQIEYFSHTLKSMCGTMQAVELRDIAAKIEVASKKQKDSNEIQELSEQMEIAYNELLPLLDDEEI